MAKPSKPQPNAVTEYLREMLDEATQRLRGIATKRMFGCHAVFANSNIFGMVWKAGRLGLKVPDATLHAKLMGLEGAGPWCPGNKTMSYWVLVPETFHDDPDELASWVRIAHRLAIAGAKAKAVKPKPRARR